MSLFVERSLASYTSINGPAFETYEMSDEEWNSKYYVKTGYDLLMESGTAELEALQVKRAEVIIKNNMIDHLMRELQNPLPTNEPSTNLGDSPDTSVLGHNQEDLLQAMLNGDDLGFLQDYSDDFTIDVIEEPIEETIVPMEDPSLPPKKDLIELIMRNKHRIPRDILRPSYKPPKQRPKFFPAFDKVQHTKATTNCTSEFFNKFSHISNEVSIEIKGYNHVFYTPHAHVNIKCNSRNKVKFKELECPIMV